MIKPTRRQEAPSRRGAALPRALALAASLLGLFVAASPVTAQISDIDNECEGDDFHPGGQGEDCSQDTTVCDDNTMATVCVELDEGDVTSRRCEIPCESDDIGQGIDHTPLQGLCALGETCVEGKMKGPDRRGYFCKVTRFRTDLNLLDNCIKHWLEGLQPASLGSNNVCSLERNLDRLMDQDSNGEFDIFDLDLCVLSFLEQPGCELVNGVPQCDADDLVYCEDDDACGAGVFCDLERNACSRECGVVGSRESFGGTLVRGCTGNLKSCDFERGRCESVSLEGLTCQVDRECPSGAYCLLGTCAPSCNRSVDCPDGRWFCTETNKCRVLPVPEADDGFVFDPARYAIRFARNSLDLDFVENSDFSRVAIIDLTTRRQALDNPAISFGFRLEVEYDRKQSTECQRVFDCDSSEDVASCEASLADCTIDPREEWIQLTSPFGVVTAAGLPGLTLNLNEVTAERLTPGRYTATVRAIYDNGDSDSITVNFTKKAVSGRYDGRFAVALDGSALNPERLLTFGMDIKVYNQGEECAPGQVQSDALCRKVVRWEDLIGENQLIAGSRDFIDDTSGFLVHAVMDGSTTSVFNRSGADNSAANKIPFVGVYSQDTGRMRLIGTIDVAEDFCLSLSGDAEQCANEPGVKARNLFGRAIRRQVEFIGPFEPGLSRFSGLYREKITGMFPDDVQLEGGFIMEQSLPDPNIKLDRAACNGPGAACSACPSPKACTVDGDCIVGDPADPQPLTCHANKCVADRSDINTGFGASCQQVGERDAVSFPTRDSIRDALEIEIAETCVATCAVPGEACAVGGVCNDDRVCVNNETLTPIERNEVHFFDTQDAFNKYLSAARRGGAASESAIFPVQVKHASSVQNAIDKLGRANRDASVLSLHDFIAARILPCDPDGNVQEGVEAGCVDEQAARCGLLLYSKALVEGWILPASPNGSPIDNDPNDPNNDPERIPTRRSLPCNTTADCYPAQQFVTPERVSCGDTVCSAVEQGVCAADCVLTCRQGACAQCQSDSDCGSGQRCQTGGFCQDINFVLQPEQPQFCTDTLRAQGCLDRAGEDGFNLFGYQEHNTFWFNLAQMLKFEGDHAQTDAFLTLYRNAVSPFRAGEAANFKLGKLQEAMQNYDEVVALFLNPQASLILDEWPIEFYLQDGNDWLGIMGSVLEDRLGTFADLGDMSKRVFGTVNDRYFMLAHHNMQHEYLHQVFLIALQRQWQGEGFAYEGRASASFETALDILGQANPGLNGLGLIPGQVYFENNDSRLENWQHYRNVLLNPEDGLMVAAQADIDDAVENLQGALEDLDEFEDRIFGAELDLNNNLNDLCGDPVVKANRCGAALDRLKKSGAEFERLRTCFAGDSNRAETREACTAQELGELDGENGFKCVEGTLDLDATFTTGTLETSFDLDQCKRAVITFNAEIDGLNDAVSCPLDEDNFSVNFNGEIRQCNGGAAGELLAERRGLILEREHIIERLKTVIFALNNKIKDVQDILTDRDDEIEQARVFSGLLQAIELVRAIIDLALKGETDLAEAANCLIVAGLAGGTDCPQNLSSESIKASLEFLVGAKRVAVESALSLLTEEIDRLGEFRELLRDADESQLELELLTRDGVSADGTGITDLFLAYQDLSLDILNVELALEDVKFQAGSAVDDFMAESEFVMNRLVGRESGSTLYARQLVLGSSNSFREVHQYAFRMLMAFIHRYNLSEAQANVLTNSLLAAVTLDDIQDMIDDLDRRAREYCGQEAIDCDPNIEVLRVSLREALFPNLVDIVDGSTTITAGEQFHNLITAPPFLRRRVFGNLTVDQVELPFDIPLDIQYGGDVPRWIVNPLSCNQYLSVLPRDFRNQGNVAVNFIGANLGEEVVEHGPCVVDEDCEAGESCSAGRCQEVLAGQRNLRYELVRGATDFVRGCSLEPILRDGEEPTLEFPIRRHTIGYTPEADEARASVVPSYVTRSGMITGCINQPERQGELADNPECWRFFARGRSLSSQDWRFSMPISIDDAATENTWIMGEGLRDGERPIIKDIVLYFRYTSRPIGE